jgi:hypothetical protein
MSVCKYCGYIGGYHAFGCAMQYAAREYVVVRSNTTTTTPKPTVYRVEWFGSLQVHQPVKP